MFLLMTKNHPITRHQHLACQNVIVVLVAADIKYGILEWFKFVRVFFAILCSANYRDKFSFKLTI
jgi:hypothetical protein